MPQIGPLEIMMVGLIALVVFGPHKLPGMARKAGRTLHDMRRAMADVKREYSTGIRDVTAGGSADAKPEGAVAPTAAEPAAPASAEPA